MPPLEEDVTGSSTRPGRSPIASLADVDLPFPSRVCCVSVKRRSAARDGCIIPWRLAGVNALHDDLKDWRYEARGQGVPPTSRFLRSGWGGSKCGGTSDVPQLRRASGTEVKGSHQDTQGVSEKP